MYLRYVWNFPPNVPIPQTPDDIPTSKVNILVIRLETPAEWTPYHRRHVARLPEIADRLQREDQS